MKDIGFTERFGLATIITGLAICLTLFLGYVFFPASHWMTVEEVAVHGGVVGTPNEMTFKRTIRRDFDGRWRVKIRRFERGGWVSTCATDWKEETYKTDARLPDPVTLEWFAWTDARCYLLRPGTYEMRVEWQIEYNTWWPRDIVRDGVIFEVRPRA